MNKSFKIIILIGFLFFSWASVSSVHSAEQAFVTSFAQFQQNVIDNNAAGMVDNASFPLTEKYFNKSIKQLTKEEFTSRHKRYFSKNIKQRLAAFDAADAKARIYKASEGLGLNAGEQVLSISTNYGRSVSALSGSTVVFHFADRNGQFKLCAIEIKR